MHILKFGGTSMDDEHTWRLVLEIISGYEHPFIVVSATAHTTRHLLKAAETAPQDPDRAQNQVADIQQRHRTLVTNFLDRLPGSNSEVRTDCRQWIKTNCERLNKLLQHIHQTGQLSPQTKDAILATGELLSSYLFARCGQAYGLPTYWLDATDIIRTDSDFGQASPNTQFIDTRTPEMVQNRLENSIPVMGGYYGQDQDGNITTLGFEGSDYTASLVGAALSAGMIEIWTDVSGVYTCDPRYVPDARPIPELSFREATELAYFGAKVLHPSTTKPASQKNIPILVKNIFAPSEPGTKITTKAASNGRAKAMTFKKEVEIMTITSTSTVMGYEFLAEIFQALEARHLAVDVVTTTEASLSVAAERNGVIEELANELQSLGTIEIQADQGIISLVGCDTGRTSSLLSDIMEDIGEEAVNLLSFSQSKQNLNIVLDERVIIPSIRAIHQRIF